MEVIERLDVKIALGDEIDKSKKPCIPGNPWSAHHNYTRSPFSENQKKLDPKAFPMQQSTEREQTSIFFRPPIARVKVVGIK